MKNSDKIEFRKAALAEARKAYIELLSGRVKSYTLDDRQLTRFDLPVLEETIRKLEEEVDALERESKGLARRKAFAVVPKDL